MNGTRTIQLAGKDTGGSQFRKGSKAGEAKRKYVRARMRKELNPLKRGARASENQARSSSPQNMSRTKATRSALVSDFKKFAAMYNLKTRTTTSRKGKAARATNPRTTKITKDDCEMRVYTISISVANKSMIVPREFRVVGILPVGRGNLIMLPNG